MNRSFDPDRFSRHALSPMEAQWADLFGETLAGIDPWLKLGYSAATLTRYLSAQSSERMAFALLIDKTPAACLTLRPNWLRGPLLELLAVLPSHQSAGLGHELIRWLADETLRLGQANLWTLTSDFNASARAFYQRQGFEEAGFLPGLIASGETEILLRLRLPVSFKPKPHLPYVAPDPS